MNIEGKMHRLAARKSLVDLKSDFNETIEFAVDPNGPEITFYLGTSSKHIGELTIDKTTDSLYRVKKSKAMKGYGPFMYDWAMEYTTHFLEASLSCDRMASVSFDAQVIWNYYLKSRSDVQKKLTLDFKEFEVFFHTVSSSGPFHSLYGLLDDLGFRNFGRDYPDLANAIIDPEHDYFDLQDIKNQWLALSESPDFAKFVQTIQSNGVFYNFKKLKVTVSLELDNALEEGWAENIGDDAF